jgi:hypothetical protein
MLAVKFLKIELKTSITFLLSSLHPSEYFVMVYWLSLLALVLTTN